MPGRELFPKVIPQLDGVRGIAVLLVLLCHAEGYRLVDLGTWGQKGWVGVDLFFVLSGFLITGILADAQAQPHYFRNFYGRRMLRIWPVYVAVVATTYLLLRSQVLPESANAYAWWPYALLVQNMAFAGAGFHALGPTWSLAIEEHFYLVWPWLMRKVTGPGLMKTLLVIICLSPVVRALGWSLGLSGYQLYKHTFLRLDGLAMGALLALWIRSSSFTPARLRKASWIALLAATPLAIWMVPPDAIATWPSIFTMSAVSLAGAGFVGLALLSNREGGMLGRTLALRPLRYVGQISYCLYLVHIPILDLLTMTNARAWITGSAPGAARVIAFLVTAFALATLSWYGFERPILRLKRYFADEEIPEPLEAAAASV